MVAFINPFGNFVLDLAKCKDLGEVLNSTQRGVRCDFHFQGHNSLSISCQDTLGMRKVIKWQCISFLWFL